MKRAWVLGQFDTADQLLSAGRKLRELRLGELDGYSPYPLHGLEDALGLGKPRVPKLVLLGGLTGAVCGYLMQWLCNAVDWPINVGGRPAHSPPTCIPITFELAVLFGAFGAFFGLFLLIGLPRLHHPVFEWNAFRSASLDRFWISVSTVGGAEQAGKITAQLRDLGANEISTVEEPA